MPNDVDNILSLLAATVVVDQRVYEDEVTAFINGVKRLSAESLIKANLSYDKIRTWFEAHQKEIRKNVTSPFFKEWVAALLDRMPYIENKSSILAVMNDIAKADGRVHISERVLVSFTENYWRAEA